MEEESWEPVFRQTSVNDAYNEFLGTFQYYYNIAMPKKRVRTNQLENKRVTSGIRVRFLNRLMKERNISEEFKKYYYRYKKIYNRVISEAKKLSNNIQINTAGNKSKAMWDLIKQELGKHKKETRNIEINVNGTNTQDPKVIANVFNDYYTSIAHDILNRNPLQKNIEVNVNAKKYNSGSMFLNPTTELEVAGIIKKLNNKKSTGVDEISDYIIKKCYPKITHALTYIINLSFSTGYFPDQLKIAKVKPLYKKGLDTEVGNYRPISLISVFSKIIEKIMQTRLLSFLKNHSIISDKQHGFCKGKSTNTAIAVS